MNGPKNRQLLNLTVAGVFWLSAAIGARGQVAEANATNDTGAVTSSNAIKLEDSESTSQTNTVSATEAQAGAGVPGGQPAVRHDQEVTMGSDVLVKPGQTVEKLVVIGGSAKVQGKVRGDVVVIRGNLDVQGEIGGDAVIVLGGATLHTNATVSGDTVTVLGSLKVDNHATIKGDAVAVCGKVDAAPEASIHGDVVPINPGGLFSAPNWLTQWFSQCAFKLRPLATQVGWVWGLAGVFFLFYLVVAAIFTAPVRATVEELTRRPATAFMMGLLTLLLFPLVSIILMVTGLGLFVVPFVLAAVFLAAVFGKVALFEWVGLGLGHRFGSGTFPKPLAAFVLGFVVITVLYLVPVLGLLTWGLTGIWGLGGGVMAAFGGLRREMPEKPASPAASTAPSYPPPVMMAAEPVAAGGANANLSSGSGSGAGAEAAPSQAAGPGPASVALQPSVPDVLAYPKASFWERMGAAFLDIILVSILGGIVHVAPLGFLVALAYFAGMWAWKGTTIGGTVLGLKVVRLDGQPVTFSVALVRALAAAFSALVLFLGFLWIAWDKDKQGWHDRIAGTVVLKLPRGMPLVCL
jgi:uncharacterized RDD family membrane protein YckC